MYWKALLVFCCFIQVARGQDPVSLDRLMAVETNGRVHLTWTISKGSTCNGTDILRSDDSLNYTVVGDIEGICGDPEKAVSYSFTDESPILNRKSYYKLDFNLAGASEALSVEVIGLNDDGLLVTPNPIVEESTIYFENKQGGVHFLNIYSMNGQLIRTLSNRSNSFDLNASELNSGMYVFTISDNKEDVLNTGKILIHN